jgi:hypothetical protein
LIIGVSFTNVSAFWDLAKLRLPSSQERGKSEVFGIKQAEKNVHEFRKFAQVVENQKNESAFQAG